MTRTGTRSTVHKPALPTVSILKKSPTSSSRTATSIQQEPDPQPEAASTSASASAPVPDHSLYDDDDEEHADKSNTAFTNNNNKDTDENSSSVTFTLPTSVHSFSQPEPEPDPEPDPSANAEPVLQLPSEPNRNTVLNERLRLGRRAPHRDTMRTEAARRATRYNTSLTTWAQNQLTASVKKGDLKEVSQLMSNVPPLSTSYEQLRINTTTSTSTSTSDTQEPTQQEPVIPLGYGFYMGTPVSPTPAGNKREIVSYVGRPQTSPVAHPPTSTSTSSASKPSPRRPSTSHSSFLNEFGFAPSDSSHTLAYHNYAIHPRTLPTSSSPTRPIQQYVPTQDFHHELQEFPTHVMRERYDDEIKQHDIPSPQHRFRAVTPPRDVQRERVALYKQMNYLHKRSRTKDSQNISQMLQEQYETYKPIDFRQFSPSRESHRWQDWMKPHSPSPSHARNASATSPIPPIISPVTSPSHGRTSSITSPIHARIPSITSPSHGRSTSVTSPSPSRTSKFTFDTPHSPSSRPMTSPTVSLLSPGRVNPPLLPSPLRTSNTFTYMQLHTPMNVPSDAIHDDSVSEEKKKYLNIDYHDRNGSTAIFHACWEGHLDILLLLCQHGASVNHRNVRVHTAMDMAIERGHIECCKVLLRYGADTTRSQAQLRYREKYGKSGLFDIPKPQPTQEQKEKSRLQAILDGKEKDDKKDKDEKEQSTVPDATMAELRSLAAKEEEKLLRLFSDPPVNKNALPSKANRADPTISPFPRSQIKQLHQTPAIQLSVAVKRGDLEKTKQILKEHPECVHFICNGCTLLYHAAWHGHQHIASELLSYGAHINALSYDQLKLEREWKAEAEKTRLAAADRQRQRDATIAARDAAEWESDEQRRRQEQAELAQVLNAMVPAVSDAVRQQRYAELVALQQHRQATLDEQRRKRRKEERRAQREADREEERKYYGFGDELGKGQTPLYIAFKRKHYQLAVMLYDKGGVCPYSRPEFLGLCGIHDEMKPLLAAITRGEVDTVRSILASTDEKVKQEMMNRQDEDGHTLLTAAVLAGDRAIADLLIRAGADVHIKDKTGRTMVEAAFHNRRFSMMEFLISDDVGGELPVERIIHQFSIDHVNDEEAIQDMVQVARMSLKTKVKHVRLLQHIVNALSSTDLPADIHHEVMDMMVSASAVPSQLPSNLGSPSLTRSASPALGRSPGKSSRRIGSNASSTSTSSSSQQQSSDGDGEHPVPVPRALSSLSTYGGDDMSLELVGTSRPESSLTITRPESSQSGESASPSTSRPHTSYVSNLTLSHHLDTIASRMNRIYGKIDHMSMSQHLSRLARLHPPTAFIRKSEVGDGKKKKRGGSGKDRDKDKNKKDGNCDSLSTSTSLEDALSKEHRTALAARDGATELAPPEEKDALPPDYRTRLIWIMDDLENSLYMSSALSDSSALVLFRSVLEINPHVKELLGVDLDDWHTRQQEDQRAQQGVDAQMSVLEDVMERQRKELAALMAEESDDEDEKKQSPDDTNYDSDHETYTAEGEHRNKVQAIRAMEREIANLPSAETVVGAIDPPDRTVTLDAWIESFDRLAATRGPAVVTKFLFDYQFQSEAIREAIRERAEASENLSWGLDPPSMKSPSPSPPTTGPTPTPKSARSRTPRTASSTSRSNTSTPRLRTPGQQGVTTRVSFTRQTVTPRR